MISPLMIRGWTMMGAATLVAGLLMHSRATIAESLTFDAALALAEQEGPSLRADTDEIESAKSAAVSAGRLPDPKLKFGIENFPVSGPPAWTLNEEFMTMGVVGLMQDVPNKAKRHAQAEAAQAGVARAEADRAIEELRVRSETAVAWINRFHLERKGALLDELDRENRLLADIVNARLAAGQALPQETVLPKLEAALLEERRDELARDITTSIAKLRRWIGDAAEQPLAGIPPHFPLQHEQMQRNLMRHPQLAAFGPMSAQAAAEVHEAESMKRPDWSVEVAYGRRDPDFGDMVTLMVNIDLPLFTKYRQDPLIASKLTEVNRVEAQREDMLRELAVELERDLAEHEQLTRAVERQRNTLIPLAREKAELTLTVYGAGSAGFEAVLSARRELIEMRLKLIDLESQLAQHEARLYYAYGEQ